MNIRVQKKLKILLIGDSCTDIYYYGTVDRISPEAPVPIFKFKYQESKPGMAENVFENFKALNCDITFVTGNKLSTKTRLIDIKSKQQLLRMDHDEESDPINNEQLGDLSYDAIVVSDYNKGAITYELIKWLRKNFIGPIFLDTKKQDLKKFNGVYVKINELEYKNSTSINDSLIVTLGSEGAMYKTLNKETYYSIPAVEVSDVCGAGDTFLAALAFKYLSSNDINSAIRFANKAASVTVQHLGNYAPTIDEITI
jgi:bifunctional ADP-heptose synthase (sugar kinase/adenylyltransferase)